MKYDVAVIGGGPAGLSACVFTRRAGLKTICFEKLAIGGQAALSYDISNYPGVDSSSGFELTQKMFKQCKDLETEFVYGEVLKIDKAKSGFTVKTKKEEFVAKKLIIACGTKPRKLGLGEERFVGKGISYCASCDGNFFKGKKVAIVGAGDSAFEYVEYLSRIAKDVILLNRSENFKAHKTRVDKAKKLKNVKILTNAIIQELKGGSLLEGIKVNLDGKIEDLPIDGVFVAIGHVPDLDFINFELETDSNGYIIVDDKMQTNVKNVYACGDILNKHFKQVITACADGAIAGNSCIGG